MVSLPLCRAAAWALGLSSLASLPSLAAPLAASDDDNTPAQQLPPLRIMPLGDSITKGNGAKNRNGYREDLRKKLLSYQKDNSDFSVDMIGSLQTGSMEDSDHEGHSGEYLADMLDNLKLSVSAEPNIVLLHAGTNNMDKEVDLDKAPELMETIIDNLFKGSPNAAVLVAPVIWANNARMQKNTDAFNKKLEGIIEKKQDDGKHILSVPTAIGKDDLWDEKHPNEKGYAKMAAAWFKAILAANEKGWIEAPDEVDQKALTGMGLGTEKNSSDLSDSSDSSSSSISATAKDDEESGSTVYRCRSNPRFALGAALVGVALGAAL